MFAVLLFSFLVVCDTCFTIKTERWSHESRSVKSHTHASTHMSRNSKGAEQKYNKIDNNGEEGKKKQEPSQYNSPHTRDGREDALCVFVVTTHTDFSTFLRFCLRRCVFVFLLVTYAVKCLLFFIHVFNVLGFAAQYIHTPSLASSPLSFSSRGTVGRCHFPLWLGWRI